MKRMILTLLFFASFLVGISSIAFAEYGLELIDMFNEGFSSPRNLIVSPSDNIYIGNTGAGEILKLSPDYDLLQVLGGFTSWGIARDNNHIYIVECPHHGINPPSGLHCVLKCNLDGSVVWMFGEYAGSDQAHLLHPSDVDVDADNNVYVADTGNNRIVKLTPNGEYVGEYTLNECANVEVYGNYLFADEFSAIGLEWFSSVVKLNLDLTETGYSALIEGNYGSILRALSVNNQGEPILLADIFAIPSRGTLHFRKYDSNMNLVGDTDDTPGITGYYTPTALDVDSQDYIYILDFYSGIYKVREAYAQGTLDAWLSGQIFNGEVKKGDDLFVNLDFENTGVMTAQYQFTIDAYKKNESGEYEIYRDNWKQRTITIHPEGIWFYRELHVPTNIVYGEYRLDLEITVDDNPLEGCAVEMPFEVIP